VGGRGKKGGRGGLPAGQEVQSTAPGPEYLPAKRPVVSPTRPALPHHELQQRATAHDAQ